MDVQPVAAKALIEQPAEQPDGSEMLVISGASGVAVPISREWGPNELRGLTSRDNLERLSRALGEPLPEDQAPPNGAN